VEKSPAALQMADEGVSLILGQDTDASDAGIHTVREGKIDDPELASKGHRGFRPPAGEILQPIAPPPREDQGKCIAREAANESRAFPIGHNFHLGLFTVV
jgi:hypothetical protein